MSLKLNDLLNEFPHIALATPAENEELLEYYHQTELAAKESAVIYKRGDHFFSFLRERSEKFLVFTLRNDQKKLQGVAVASFRPGYIAGELQTIGYLGDLRVSLNRKLIREWRKFYGQFLEKSPELEETGHCRYFQTALMSTNAYSKNNLADTKIPNLYYKELARYQMINIIGKFGKPSTSNQVRYAGPSDKEALLVLLEEDHKQRMFGHDWSKEFDRRLSEWKNFTLENWIVVRNAKGKLLAATCLWNPIESKQIIVPKIPFAFTAISKMAAVVPGLQLKPLPIAGKPIDILYINQLSFIDGLERREKQMILRSVIELAFQKKFHMLAYCDFEREGLTRSMKGLITQKNQMGFYTVHYKDEKGTLRDELALNDKMQTPAFDMALV